MTDNYKQELAARVKQACSGRTDRELGAAAGVSAETVRRYRAGLCMPTASFLHTLCTRHDISAAWLLGGEGPMCRHEWAADQLRTASDETIMRILAERLDGGPGLVRDLLRQQRENAAARNGHAHGTLPEPKPTPPAAATGASTSNEPNAAMV